jgi:uncharacterized GH25 family protein
MRRILVLSAVFLVLLPVSGHEFWLHPSKFLYNPGESINIKFMVGENYEGENWRGNNKRIQDLSLYSANQKQDISSKLSQNEGDSLNIIFSEQGSVMFTFNSTNSFIELEAGKFLEYLKEDGLQNAIDYRLKNKETDSAGKEFYQRSVKTLIQVGKKNDDVYKTETTLPLDIIPQKNPYALTKSDSITLKILFKKKPLTNYTIIAWHRINNKTTKSEYTSNAKGDITIPVKTTGRWMVSTVKMERLPSGEKAQWQSYWGSVTWGYE